MKNSLFKLIKSLSTAEKRQFKVFSKHSNASSKYILLFDAINKQANYNEAKLIKKFSYEANPNGFAVAKNHLYNSILEFLRSKSKNHSTLDGALKSLQDIESLYRHQLYPESLQLTKRTIEYCKKNHLNNLIPILSHWILRVAYNIESQDKTIQLIKQSMQLKDDGIDNIKNDRTYESLYEQAFLENTIYGLAKKGASLNRMMAIKNSKYLQNFDLALSESAQIAFHLAHIQIAKSEADSTKQLIHCQSAYKIAKKPGFKATFFKLLTLTEYLEAILHNLITDKYDLIYEELINLEVPPRVIDIERNKEQSILYIKTVKLNFIGTTENLNSLEQRINDYLSKYGNYTSHPHETAILLNLAAFYYMTGELEKSAKWTKMLANKITKENNQDQYIQFCFLFGVLYLDMGKVDVFQDSIPDFKRYLIQRDKMTPTEAFVFKAFKALANVYNNKKARHDALKALLVELKTIASYMNNRSAINLNQAIIWAESKLKNKTMMQIIQEKAQRQLRLRAKQKSDK